MNILFITGELPYPPDSGHKKRSFHLLRGFGKKNSLFLVSFGKDKDYPRQLREVCDYIDVVKKPSYNKIVFFLQAFLSLFSKIPFNIHKYYSKEMTTKINTLLKKKRFDLIICNQLSQAQHILNKNCIKIYTSQNIESTIIYRYYKITKNHFKKILLYLEWFKTLQFEKKVWRNFDYTVAVSQHDKEMIQSINPTKDILVIPNGVDTQYFYPQESNNVTPNLVYTGEIGWYPNEEAVIYFVKKIYPMIKEKKSGVKFFVVGRNPSKKIIELNKKDKSIIVTGYVDDVRPYIAQSSIYIVPIRIGSGTRLKILEAMAMGKPVVSTTIGCEGLEVTPGENIILADKPEEFALNVINLIEDKNEAKKLSYAGRMLVEEKYDWKVVYSKIDELCNRLEERIKVSRWK